MSALEAGLLAATIIGFVPLYIDLVLRMREQKPHFKFYRSISETTDPIDTKMSITVLHPDKVIENCQVTYNGNLLPCRKINGVIQYQKYIDVMGGEVFRIPAGREDEEATVIVKDGKKKLRPPLKLKNLPWG
jgi:hypothetical protein